MVFTRYHNYILFCSWFKKKRLFYRLYSFFCKRNIDTRNEIKMNRRLIRTKAFDGLLFILKRTKCSPSMKLFTCKNNVCRAGY